MRTMNSEEIANRMRALGNASRLAVYRTLVRAGKKGLPVTQVQQRVGIPASTLTHHLHKLIEVGLVRQVREGTRLICHADYEAMIATFDMFARECCADEGCG